MGRATDGSWSSRYSSSTTEPRVQQARVPSRGPQDTASQLAHSTLTTELGVSADPGECSVPCALLPQPVTQDTNLSQRTALYCSQAVLRAVTVLLRLSLGVTVANMHRR